MKSLSRIVVATSNDHKTGEIAAALRHNGCTIEVVSAKAVGGMPAVEENAQSFVANARLKAEALLRRVSIGDGVLADDSGLCVDSLEGAPGVLSARFAGPDASDEENNRKLLSALDPIAPEKRTARFVCSLVLLGEGIDETFFGECLGSILRQPAGTGGFGYDPLFVPTQHNQSLAELGPTVKAEISHRARACQMLSQWLISNLH